MRLMPNCRSLSNAFLVGHESGNLIAYPFHRILPAYATVRLPGSPYSSWFIFLLQTPCSNTLGTFVYKMSRFWNASENVLVTNKQTRKPLNSVVLWMRYRRYLWAGRKRDQFKGLLVLESDPKTMCEQNQFHNQNEFGLSSRIGMDSIIGLVWVGDQCYVNISSMNDMCWGSIPRYGA